MCKSREHRARDQCLEGEGVKELERGPSWIRGHFQIFQSSDGSRLVEGRAVRRWPSSFCRVLMFGSLLLKIAETSVLIQGRDKNTDRDASMGKKEMKLIYIITIIFI